MSQGLAASPTTVTAPWTIIFLVTGNFTVSAQRRQGDRAQPGPGPVPGSSSTINDPGDPDDDVELSFEQIKESTGRTDDFCAAVVAALA